MNQFVKDIFNLFNRLRLHVKHQWPKQHMKINFLDLQNNFSSFVGQNICQTDMKMFLSPGTKFATGNSFEDLYEI